ncbi:MAG TPA: hypothetical protein PKE63_02910 [Lacibacter sp.]|nr:hypothetical protein [Lacibacter sp.]
MTLFFVLLALASAFTALGATPFVAVLVAGGIIMVGKLVPAQSGILGAYVGSTGSMSSGETNIQVITTERDRAVLEHNRNRAEFAGRKLTPSFLRLEAPVVNNATKLRFPTFTGDATTVYPTERRLDRNDDFIATKMGFFLLKQDTANNKTNGKLQSYPNITIFGAAAAADLMGLYESGVLKVNIGREDKFVALDLHRFLDIPETQQSGASNFDQFSGKKSGLIDLTPQLILNGNGTNEIEIDFTSYAGWAGGTSSTEGFTHRAVLYFSGLLATGAQTR